MARRTRTTTLVWLRRAVQTAFLLLFLYLFLETVYHPINRVGGGVKLFFQLDPLVMLTDWLASHALAAGMLLSVATLGVTFLFGRWFCGWICPFGTVHQLFSSLRGGSVKARLGTGGYGRWQKAKYYVLVANGPAGGNLADVRRRDTIVAGVDQVAVDAFGATLLGLRPQDIGYVVEGHARGLGNMNYAALSPARVEV